MYQMEAAVQAVTRSYDIICFGDEVPGILALVCAAREFYRRKNQYPRTLLLFKGNSKFGIGGHLVRGGLAYLDRSSIPVAIQQERKLDTFGDSPAIYQEFLSKSQVEQIALDPKKADFALREMLRETHADILSNVEIKSVVQQGHKISGIELTKGEIYFAKQFIDCTVNAELAQATVGVSKYKGFETIGLPDSELSVTLVFETQGLSVEKLQNIEYQYLKRFTNLADKEAQALVNIAAGGDANYAEQLRKDLVDKKGYLKAIAIGKDYLDIRSPALSIAYHAFRGTKLDLAASKGIFNNGNVALLSSHLPIESSNHRMSWNALLFSVSADEAEILARGKAQPTRKMLDEMLFVTSWLRSLGAVDVKPAKELYIRHAGNITNVVEPLTGAKMLAGGVPANEALGTFGYDFDFRGAIQSIIQGMEERAKNKNFGNQEFGNKGFGNLAFLTPPLFNIGIQHALIKYVPNLAVVGSCSGFEGYACLPGRIVEFNCGVGQGIGIAAGIALAQDREINEVSNKEVRDVMESIGILPQIYGTTNEVAAAQLDDFEHSITA
ncbi:MAG: FAD-dependent oxidoreductase [Methylacidiphilales bacterium]|nr:FAD-dependent oxidoreductase [Candidatus Methylacidiphilales bacterium]NJR16853.1 FAD-dependent oxidoreductase [Calothrix sp. CSU_2_0]